MLIGDAAGLAYAQSGEGIRPAVESALLAADVIRSCENDFSIDALYPYLEEMEQRFGRRQPGAGLLELLPVRLKQMVASQLLKHQWVVKNLVVSRWFLHRQDQALRVPQQQTYQQSHNPG
jgi:hypothetical protein